MANDLTKIPVAVILDLINTSNPGQSFTQEMLQFDLPIVDTGSKNTSLTVTAEDGSGYKGSVVIKYNRLHLTTQIASVYVAAGAGRDMVFMVGDATKISDIIPEINARLGINLTADDYVDGNLPAFSGTLNEVHDVQVVANADSLCYTNSLTFQLKSEEVELSSVITTTELNGLTYAPPAGA